MRSIIPSSLILTLLSGTALLLSSCTEGDLSEPDGWKPGIYFQEDSVRYSFGITPIEVESHLLTIPLRIMGEPQSRERAFAIEVDAEETTAEVSTHYVLGDPLVVMADSVNAYLPLTILRSALGEEEYRLSIRLKESEEFTPVNENYQSVSIYFNNQVEKPSWWDGSQSKVGAWKPIVYIKFMEFFAEMETTSPVTYRNMVEKFGPYLENSDYWFWDYDNSLNKYVLIPLYRFFTEEHPEMGVTTIPRPSGY